MRAPAPVRTHLQAELVGQGKHQRVLEARGIQQLVAAQSDGVGPATGGRGDWLAPSRKGLFLALGQSDGVGPAAYMQAGRQAGSCRGGQGAFRPPLWAR